MLTSFRLEGFEENGKRIDELKMVLSRCAYAASFFDQDGIRQSSSPFQTFLPTPADSILPEIRFMNTKIETAINSEAGAASLIQKVHFDGMTPLGTNLQKKVLEPLVLQPARHGSLRKPVLIITITDGECVSSSSSSSSHPSPRTR